MDRPVNGSTISSRTGVPYKGQQEDLRNQTSLYRSTKHARTTPYIMFMKQSSSVLALESMQLNFAHHTFVVRNLSHLGSRFRAAAHQSVRRENRRHLPTSSCKSNSYPTEYGKCNPSQTYCRMRRTPSLRPAYANSFERGGPGYQRLSSHEKVYCTAQPVLTHIHMHTVDC